MPVLRCSGVRSRRSSARERSSFWRSHSTARLSARILAHHDGAGTRGGVEPDDFSLAELLHTLDRAPFTHWIDFEGTLAQLRFFPALGKVLDPALHALGIVLVIFDIEPFVGKKA